jgi:hypothetical protein
LSFRRRRRMKRKRRKKKETEYSSSLCSRSYHKAILGVSFSPQPGSKVSVTVTPLSVSLL